MTWLLRSISGLLMRPVDRFVLIIVLLLYAMLYLWLTGDIAGGGSGWQASFPAWQRVFEIRGPFQFEPVGLIMLGALVWTFSPLNTLLATIMGLLLGLNILAGWRLWRLPRSCALGGSGTGLFAAIPALLAGGACCAPMLLIWLGLPIAGALTSLTPILVPVALSMLGAGLWFNLRRLAT